MFIKNYISFFLFLCFSFSVLAQSPYDLSWKKESILLGLGGLTQGVAAFIESDIHILTESDIQDYNRSSISELDVQATYFLSGKAHKSSDHFRGGSYVLPALLLIPERSRKDFHKIGLIYGETLLLTKGVTYLTKTIVKRPRPFVFNDKADLSLKTERSARYSFFSGHTSVTAANCFFFAKVFSDYYPDSKLKPYVWGVSIFIPAAVGYFRVRAGMHFPTDVITGYALGALIGYMVPQLHKTNKKMDGLSLTTGINSFALSYTF